MLWTDTSFHAGKTNNIRGEPFLCDDSERRRNTTSVTFNSNLVVYGPPTHFSVGTEARIPVHFSLETGGRGKDVSITAVTLLRVGGSRYTCYICLVFFFFTTTIVISEITLVLDPAPSRPRRYSLVITRRRRLPRYNGRMPSDSF